MRIKIKNRITRYAYRKARIKLFYFDFFILRLKMISHRKPKPHQRKNQPLIFNQPKVLQQKIDSLSYPPTHEYVLETLEPKGLLQMRYKQFRIIAPHFFTVDKFLDVGCNKGFFSLLACKNSTLVHSLDVDEKFVDLCNDLKQSNMNVKKTTFREFYTDIQYDSILLGNVYHYLFRECKGWDWIYKLAAISKGYVLIEGAINMNNKPMRDAIPKELHHDFTYEKFIDIMTKFFTLELKTKSAIQARYVMLFKRRSHTKDVDLDSLPILKPIKETKHSFTFLTKVGQNNFVAKINKKPLVDLKINTMIASMSPHSNGIVCDVNKNGSFFGWLEKVGGSPYKEFENQKKLLIIYCNHMMFLARLGYIETDFSGTNVFTDTNKIFDKGGVMPIKSMHKSVYDKFSQNPKGFFFLHYQAHFDLLKPDDLVLIYNALKSREPQTIENTFTRIRDGLLEQ